MTSSSSSRPTKVLPDSGRTAVTTRAVFHREPSRAFPLFEGFGAGF
jgi:hypothetical protein